MKNKGMNANYSYDQMPQFPTRPRYYDRQSANLISKPHLEKIRTKLEELDQMVPQFGKHVSEVVDE